MIRPTYENRQSLSAEGAFLKRIASKYENERHKFHKLPIKYGLDYGLFSTKDSGVSWFMELKCRTCASTAFKTYMVSLDKILKANQLMEFAPCFLFVQWTDRAGFIKLEDVRWKFDAHWMGRKDRGDSQDMEPCVLIDISDFKFQYGDGGEI
jgi:hypothetical protein